MQRPPKAEVTGSNPVGCANLSNELAHTGSLAQRSLSAECPRNVFAGRSGHSEVPVENAHDIATGCRQSPSASAVREQLQSTGCETSQHQASRPAHPSNRFIAQLNTNWRVVNDPLQWVLQRRKGNPRKRNSGWQDRSFCTTRAGLLRCVRELCGAVSEEALTQLHALP